jgi:hypothetical protein
MRRNHYAAAVIVLALATGGAAASRGAENPGHAQAGKTLTHRSIARERFVYPLKVAKSRRYLVDQRGTPFMIVGDSPQSMIGNLSLEEAASYIANRKAAGFNALLVDVLCVQYTGCRQDGTTADGIEPFTTPGDLSTPNPAYFERVDAMLRLVARAGMVVFLDPIETGGWLGVMKSNGVDKDFAYGRFLGERYRSFGNIVWSNGNDHQTWRDPSDDAVVLAVARGIRSVDRAHLQTVELDYYVSSSLDDARWRPLIGLDAAYSYRPTYAEVLRAYSRKKFMPVFMVEAGYEFEQNSSDISYGDPDTLRREEYWTALSGAGGQFYGSSYTWSFKDGWQDHLDTPGTAQLAHLVKLFSGLPWFRLVPDRSHRIVTRGYGTFSASGPVDSSDYVTTAATPDGRLALSYLPAGGTITVDLTRFVPPLHARWFDPSNGVYRPVAGAPFAHKRAVDLTAPDKNADGDRDWVLVLSTA